MGASVPLDKNHSFGFTVFGPLGGGSGIKRGMAPSITCIRMLMIPYGDDNGWNLKSTPWIPSSLFSRPDSCPQWWSSRRFPATSFSNRSFFHRGNVKNIVEPQKKKIVNKTQSEAPILWSSFVAFAFLTGEVCKMQMRTWQFAAHQENLFCKSYKLGPVDNSVVTSSAIEALWCFWWWYFYACKANKDILFKISSILLISFIGLRKMSPCRLSCLGGASAQTWE